MPENGEQQTPNPRLVIEFEGPGMAGCTVTGLDKVSPPMMAAAVFLLDELAHNGLRNLIAANAQRQGIVVPMAGHLGPGGAPRRQS